MKKNFRTFIEEYDIDEKDPFYGLAELFFKMKENQEVLMNQEKANKVIAQAMSSGISSGIKEKLEVSMGNIIIDIDYNKLAEALIKKEKKSAFSFLKWKN